MALETGTYISDLVITNPTSTDPKSEGDNHLRLIKSTIKTTFPNVTGAVTKTHTQLNNTLDKTGDTMTGPLAQAAGTAALPSYTFSGDTNTGMWSPAADTVAVSTAGAEHLRIDSSGNLLVTGSGGLGYGVGSGGAVTQATSKSTAVTLNKPSGRITMNNASLPTGTWVDFQLSNSVIGASDGILVNLDFATLGTVAYQLEAHVATGQARIRVRQDSGVSLSEAVVINFQVIKGVSS